MTYFVGIDISKFKHDYCIINENGECIHQASITNDIEGFNSLLLFLNSLDITETKRIGFEATGHYGSNLKRFLDSKDLDYMEINPLLLKEFSKSLSLRRIRRMHLLLHFIYLLINTFPILIKHITWSA